MKFGILTSDQRTEWNDAVTHIPDATFYHLYEWRDVMARCFSRFEPVYLYARGDGDICGLLPLFHVRRAPFGSALISIPLGVYGGVIASQPDVIEPLMNFAFDEAKRRGVGYIECRNPRHTSHDWIDNTRYATFQKTLPDSAEDTLLFIPRKQRAEVRKGIKLDLEVRFSNSVDPFFNVYATSMRNLGSPVFRAHYYQTLLDVFPDHSDVLTVLHKGMPVSSVLNFYFRDQVLPFYGGGLPAARPTNAFPYMYWALMRHAVERGYRQYDFGRSLIGSGAYAFKKNFGFEPQPLHYQTRLVTDKSAPDISPNNPTYKTLIKLWKHLPVPLANRLGPLVAPLTV